MTVVNLGERIWVKIVCEQEGDSWSAFCETLHLASAGGTKEEATRNLRNAIQSYAGVLQRNGLLERVMGEKGIRFEPLMAEGELEEDEIAIDIMEEPRLTS